MKKLERTVATSERRESLAKTAAKETANVAVAVGAAATMGAVRGHFEKKGKDFQLPLLKIDAELGVGAGMVLLGMTNYGGKYRGYLRNGGVGILSHWAGQAARNSLLTGKVSLIAGESTVAGSLSGNAYGQIGGEHDEAAIPLEDIAALQG